MGAAGGSLVFDLGSGRQRGGQVGGTQPGRAQGLDFHLKTRERRGGERLFSTKDYSTRRGLGQEAGTPGTAGNPREGGRGQGTYNRKLMSCG